MPVNFLISGMPLTNAQITSLKEKNIWKEEGPVHYSELTILKVPYINFEGFSQIGELMIAKKVENQVSLIFQELYHRTFPIQQIQLIDEFDGDDIASMEANNSSAYNGRRVMNTDRWSSHAYGLAIDINPVQNPYLQFHQATSSIKVFPTNGLPYVNRNIQVPGMVEEIVAVFAKYGFTEWGGNWQMKPDYHHFQIPWPEIEKMFPNHHSKT